MPTLADQYVHSAIYAETYVPNGVKSNEWTLLSRVINDSTEGDQVAVYGQAVNNRSGVAWGGVFEVEDLGTGGFWGVEIDAMSNGPANSRRRALGIVVGRQSHSGTSTIDYGIHLLPFFQDQGAVDVVWGLKVDVPCRASCISVPAGQTITLDERGFFALRFDPQTGILGFWDMRLTQPRLVWGVNMDNKRVYQTLP